jgi:NADH:ubiquinone oxidoreductase subunit 6 (subunit J)
MAVLTVGGAIVALEADEIVYGAMGLAGSLLGVATLFFLLNAPYVAVFQVTVYVGAVAVLILFTVMLVRQEKWAKEVAPTSWTKIVGALSGVAVSGAIIFAAVSSDFSGETSIQNTADFLQIGQLISTGYAPVLEVLALVLAAYVIGALTLSRADKEAPEE